MRFLSCVLVFAILLPLQSLLAISHVCCGAYEKAQHFSFEPEIHEASSRSNSCCAASVDPWNRIYIESADCSTWPLHDCKRCQLQRSLKPLELSTYSERVSVSLRTHSVPKLLLVEQQGGYVDVKPRSVGLGFAESRLSPILTYCVWRL